MQSLKWQGNVVIPFYTYGGAIHVLHLTLAFMLSIKPRIKLQNKSNPYLKFPFTSSLWTTRFSSKSGDYDTAI